LFAFDDARAAGRRLYALRVPNDGLQEAVRRRHARLEGVPAEILARKRADEP